MNYHYYYEVSVRFDKVQETGLIKKVTEKYVVDALSFTEAEARITKEMAAYVSGEFDIPAIKRLDIAEVFENADAAADYWFKAKLAYITLDEKTGKEKYTPQSFLVKAKDLGDARAVIQKNMEGTLGDWKETQLQETPIMDVFGKELA